MLHLENFGNIFHEANAFLIRICDLYTYSNRPRVEQALEGEADPDRVLRGQVFNLAHSKEYDFVDREENAVITAFADLPDDCRGRWGGRCGSSRRSSASDSLLQLHTLSIRTSKTATKVIDVSEVVARLAAAIMEKRGTS